MTGVAFTKAARENVHLLIGIAGPSSSGKTFSALRLATGLAEGKPIFFIDTEGRRGLHYADQFDFQYTELTTPFSPAHYEEAMRAAVAGGAAVVIVDSMSHAHEGQGGLLEMHEAELQRMGGDDYSKRERVKFAAWIKPKSLHNRFLNTVLQLPVHQIFAFRAKEKLALVKNAQGKQEPVSQGWQPICSDRFEYEMTAMLILPAGARGVPNLSAEAAKFQGNHRAIFGKGEQISEDMGKQLAEWARGPKVVSPDPGQDPAFQIAEPYALGGRLVLRDYWKKLSKAQKKATEKHIDALGKIADQADAEKIARSAALLDAKLRAESAA